MNHKYQIGKVAREKFERTMTALFRAPKKKPATSPKAAGKEEAAGPMPRKD
jgi:hypothetical protein